MKATNLKRVVSSFSNAFFHIYIYLLYILYLYRLKSDLKLFLIKTGIDFVMHKLVSIAMMVVVDFKWILYTSVDRAFNIHTI